MNTYLIPIADIEAGETWIHKVNARSLEDCKEKLIEYFSSEYEIDFSLDWNEFINEFNDHDFLIGEIIDIEEI